MHEFEMVGRPNEGRVFEMSDRVRFNDVARNGHLKLDALIRYSQVISNDDTRDAALADDLTWIARSTVVDLHQAAHVDEEFVLTTFCAGLGRTWAQRRVSLAGSAGGRYEVATLWIFIDPEARAPRRLSEQFLELYGPAAGGRRVSAKQRISRPSGEVLNEGERLQWLPRSTDFDRFGHMNNLVYWSALQHAMGGTVPERTRLLIEHGAGVEPDHQTEAVIARETDLRMWWLTNDDTGHLSDQYLAAAQIGRLD